MQPINVKRTFKKILDISKLNTSYTFYKQTLKDKKGQPARQDELLTLKLHLCFKFKPGHFHLSFEKQHA